MKNLLLFLATLIPIVSLSNTVTLEQAIKSGFIKVNVTGNPTPQNPGGSSHTGKCLRIQLLNTGSQLTTLQIENAYRFSNEDEHHQDLMTCEHVLLKLASKQTLTIFVNALCCEMNNGAPSETDTFHFVRKEIGAIGNLCELLERQRNFGNTAQQAMWCLTDNAPLENIYDTHPDTNLENELITFIAREKGLPVPEREHAPVRILRYAAEVEGTYTQWVEKPVTIGIYITDSLNHELITLMPDEHEHRINGTLKYTYGYRGLLPKGRYKLQAKIDGAWKKEKDIVIEGTD